MSKFKVYLAGPIAGLTYDEGQDWREYAMAALDAHGIAGYSPLRNKSFLRSAGVIGKAAYANPMASDRGIMARDHNDCKTSDAILVNLMGAKSVSQGTVMEIAWAYAYRIPLVVAMEETSNLHDHPMIRAALDYRVTSLDQAIAIVAAVLLPNADEKAAQQPTAGDMEAFYSRATETV